MSLFVRGKQREHINVFLWYGSVVGTHKVCFWLKIGFSNALGFHWNFAFSFYIDFRQDRKSAINQQRVDRLTSYVFLFLEFSSPWIHDFVSRAPSFLYLLLLNIRSTFLDQTLDEVFSVRNLNIFFQDYNGKFSYWFRCIKIENSRRSVAVSTRDETTQHNGTQHNTSNLMCCEFLCWDELCCVVIFWTLHDFAIVSILLIPNLIHRSL